MGKTVTRAECGSLSSPLPSEQLGELIDEDLTSSHELLTLSSRVPRQLPASSALQLPSAAAVATSSLLHTEELPGHQLHPRLSTSAASAEGPQREVLTQLPTHSAARRDGEPALGLLASSDNDLSNSISNRRSNIAITETDSIEANCLSNTPLLAQRSCAETAAAHDFHDRLTAALSSASLISPATTRSSALVPPADMTDGRTPFQCASTHSTTDSHSHSVDRELSPKTEPPIAVPPYLPSVSLPTSSECSRTMQSTSEPIPAQCSLSLSTSPLASSPGQTSPVPSILAVERAQTQLSSPVMSLLSTAISMETIDSSVAQPAGISTQSSGSFDDASVQQQLLLLPHPPPPQQQHMQMVRAASVQPSSIPAFSRSAAAPTRAAAAAVAAAPDSDFDEQSETRSLPASESSSQQSSTYAGGERDERDAGADSNATPTPTPRDGRTLSLASRSASEQNTPPAVRRATDSEAAETRRGLKRANALQLVDLEAPPTDSVGGTLAELPPADCIGLSSREPSFHDALLRSTRPEFSCTPQNTRTHSEQCISGQSPENSRTPVTLAAITVPYVEQSEKQRLRVQNTPVNQFGAQVEEAEHSSDRGVWLERRTSTETSTTPTKRKSQKHELQAQGEADVKQANSPAEEKITSDVNGTKQKEQLEQDTFILFSIEKNICALGVLFDKNIPKSIIKN